ncbi:RNA-binding domain-containing protein, partial [Saitoella complicata NRRL Y-17804]
PKSDRPKPSACLFVASLAASRTDEQLLASVSAHFAKWGPPLHVKVLKDPLQRPYAFVQFSNDEEATRAMTEAHNTVVDGRHIRVEKARVNRTIWI